MFGYTLTHKQQTVIFYFRGRHVFPSNDTYTDYHVTHALTVR